MKEERMAILRMVAEGKINADEAEILLEALGRPKEKTKERRSRQHRRGRRGHRVPRPPRMPKGMGDFVESADNFARDLTDSIVDSVQESLGAFEREFESFEQSFDSSPYITSVSPGTTLLIKSQAGGVTLFGTDEEALKVSGPLKKHYKVKQHHDKIEIKVKRFEAALTVHIPRSVERLIVKTQLGEVIGQNFTNSLQDILVKTQTGSINLAIGTITEGRIRLVSQTGQVKLRLSERSACEIKAAAAHMGEIETDLPLTAMQHGIGYLKGTLNGGGAKVHLETQTGGIFIEATEATEATEEIDEIEEVEEVEEIEEIEEIEETTPKLAQSPLEPMSPRPLVTPPIPPAPPTLPEPPTPLTPPDVST